MKPFSLRRRTFFDLPFSLLPSLFVLPLLALPLFLPTAHAEPPPSKPPTHARKKPPPRPRMPNLSFARSTEPAVYHEKSGSIHPDATRLCTLFYEFPEQQKASCCKTAPGSLLTRECIRILSAALYAREVTFQAARFSACEIAFRQTFQGCDWLGPWLPPMPLACDGLLLGSKAEDTPCRSSLECKEGLQCRGLGPMSRGFCQPPKPTQAFCNRAADPLIVYTRQDHSDLRHPECVGFCQKYRCAPTLPLGAPCSADVQCGNKAHCDGSICQPSPAAKARMPCTGRCQEGYRCWNFFCQTPLPQGSPCTEDGQCRAACEPLPSSKSWTCQPRCGFRMSSGPSLTTLLERYRKRRAAASRPASQPAPR